jgi:uncharacterized membrane protein
MNDNKQISTRVMVLTAALTAMVVVLQLLGSFIRFGIFSISLVLVPIVIGASICGAGAGAWLGFAFGLAVLFSGDAYAFLVIDPVGTVLTVLTKGTVAGLFSGVIYKLLDSVCKKVKDRTEPQPLKWAAAEKLREWVLKYLPVITAAVVCPVVNTGIFLVGCNLFFFDTVAEWGRAAGYTDAVKYMFLGLAGGNFLFELLFNVLLSPTIVRVLSINEKIFKF